MPALALTAEQAGRAGQAHRLLQGRRCNEALDIARRLAEEAPQSPDAQQLLALCSAEAGDPQGAEQAFRRALAQAPGQPMILANFAALLRRLGRHREAVQALREAVTAAPAFATAWRSLGLAALDLGDTGLACEALQRAVELAPADAGNWHALGHAQRAAGDLPAAEQSLRRTLGLAPNNASAWLNLGAVRRLQGRPDDALACYERARQSGHVGPDLDHALSGALVDLGRPDEALEAARRLVQAHPQYAAGHVTLAHLTWEYGRGADTAADALAGFRATARAQPGNRQLQSAWAGFLLNARQAEEALACVKALRAQADDAQLATLHASALEALGQADEASSLFEQVHRQLGPRAPADFLNTYARHLLKAGRWDLAEQRATEATRIAPANQEAWAYLGTAWRLLGDPREDWLCDYETLVGRIAVEPPPEVPDTAAFLQALQAVLAPLHQAQHEPVHQSLRGGSQTPGRLFGRDDPVLRAAQQALLRSVETWLAALPRDPAHPFLGRIRRSVEICGSWSVKLWSSGSHVNHIHSEGWMSSAFYVSLPPSVLAQPHDGGQAGHIQFGQPPLELELGLPPRRVIRPEPGHLALFPSYLWHGTIPFQDEAPRITIAFDMLPRG